MGATAGPLAALFGSLVIAPLLHAMLAAHAGRLWSTRGYVGAWLLSSGITTGLFAWRLLGLPGSAPDTSRADWLAQLSWAAAIAWCLALGAATWLIAKNASTADKSGTAPMPLRVGCLGFALGLGVATLPFLVGDFVELWRRVSG